MFAGSGSLVWNVVLKNLFEWKARWKCKINNVTSVTMKMTLYEGTLANKQESYRSFLFSALCLEANIGY